MMTIFFILSEASKPAIWKMMKIGDNMSRTREAIVVKVNESSLGTIGINDTNSLFYVNFL